MKLGILFLGALIICSCEKKAVTINPDWAKDWVYAYDHEQTLSIQKNGWAVYDTKKGKHRGYARIQDKTLKIGLTGRFLIMKTPEYFGVPLNRWQIEIDNMQFVQY